MRQYIFLFSILLLAFKGYAQILFEEGHYIDNDSRRVDCLIRFVDWKSNPSGFDYKLTPNGEVKRAGIGEVKEFGIGDVVKYVRATVGLDRSTEETTRLTTDRNPVFAKEELFLNALVEGDAGLYSYVEGNLVRLFFQKGSGPVEALVYKLYKTSDGLVAKNNLYQKQLLDSLNCGSVTEDEVKNLRYRKDDLVRFFKKYHTRCSGSEAIVYGEKKKGRDLFNLSIRPRLNHSSLSVSYNMEFFGFDAVDYGSQFNFGLGADAEFILPFFRNKWVVALEPAYQGGFKGEREIKLDFLRERDLQMNVEYKALELPVGVRYYMFLNEKSKISVNAYYLLHFGSKSRINFSGSGSFFYGHETIEPKPRPTFILGLAYKFNNRLGLEARYYLKRNITGDLLYWYSEYKTVSLALGLSLF